MPTAAQPTLQVTRVSSSDGSADALGTASTGGIAGQIGSQLGQKTLVPAPTSPTNDYASKIGQQVGSITVGGMQSPGPYTPIPPTPAPTFSFLPVVLWGGVAFLAGAALGAIGNRKQTPPKHHRS
jgi:hypothetical protein